MSVFANVTHAPARAYESEADGVRLVWWLYDVVDARKPDDVTPDVGTPAWLETDGVVLGEAEAEGDGEEATETN